MSFSDSDLQKNIHKNQYYQNLKYMTQAKFLQTNVINKEKNAYN